MNERANAVGTNLEVDRDIRLRAFTKNGKMIFEIRNDGGWGIADPSACSADEWMDATKLLLNECSRMLLGV